MLDAGLDPHHRPNPRLAGLWTVMFLLHAEHEMNCSTAAARHLPPCVRRGRVLRGRGRVGALYGPLHGGANEAVLKMLARIGNKEAIPAFLKRVKDKKEKMFGFGHRVYKNFDPRANVSREVAEEVFRLVGRDPLIDVAVELEKAARQDEYFVQRMLYPNVDFYSGLVYRALGFPPEFFTVLFAVPRAAGYLAHWRESLTDPDAKIARPQQVYQGEWLRSYPALAARPPASSDSMWHVQVSNASRRRLAGGSSSGKEFRPSGSAGGSVGGGRVGQSRAPAARRRPRTGVLLRGRAGRRHGRGGQAFPREMIKRRERVGTETMRRDSLFFACNILRSLDENVSRSQAPPSRVVPHDRLSNPRRVRPHPPPRLLRLARRVRHLLVGAKPVHLVQVRFAVRPVEGALDRDRL